MASEAQGAATAAPDGFGSAVRDIAFFPVVMSAYAIFYAVWWPFAWGWAGAAALLVVLVAAVFLVVRGVTPRGPRTTRRRRSNGNAGR